MNAESLRTSIEELRVEFSIYNVLLAYASTAGHDEVIEAHQQDRIESLIERLQALVAEPKAS